MNSLQRVQAVIEGRIPDRIPVCLHNFLAATREAGVSMERYRVDPEAMAQIYIQSVEKYGHDCIMIDPDTTLLAEALGAKSDCTPGEPAHICAPAINRLEEVDCCRNSQLPTSPLLRGVARERRGVWPFTWRNSSHAASRGVFLRH